MAAAAGAAAPAAGRSPGRSPSRPPCRTVRRFAGRLVRIDDFYVVIGLEDGTIRTVRRFGDTPKVTIDDPLEPHRKLLTVYTDKDIHDVTAYPVTLK